MVAKLVLVLSVLSIIIALSMLAAYRYFDNRAEEEHEIRKMREERDSALLNNEDSYIEQELEQERNN